MTALGTRASGTLDETQLVARLRAGDEAAYEVLVRSYTTRLLAVTRRIVGTEADARDAVQDVFITVFRKLDDFEGESRLSTWLYRVAVNTALMKLRTRRRQREDPIEPLLPAYQDDGHHVEEFCSWDEPPDDALARKQRQAYVRGCIDRLPEAYRTVLLLRDIEQMDTEETAAVLGDTVNAVKIRLHRARQALRTMLNPRFVEASRDLP
jgi:RNA polymerase sigma-70 factor (ECF subfamily)